MQLVDANVVLRYILGDNPALSAKARHIIESHVVEVPMEVLCEVVFVLSSVYKIAPGEVGAALQGFFEKTACTLPHREVALQALALFMRGRMDFVDCLLVGYKNVLNAEVYTFDVPLQKQLST